MINNINALVARVQALEIEVATLKNEKEILMGLTLELEERLSKLEQMEYDNLLEGTLEDVVDDGIGGTIDD